MCSLKNQAEKWNVSRERMYRGVEYFKQLLCGGRERERMKIFRLKGID